MESYTLRSQSHLRMSAGNDCIVLTGTAQCACLCVRVSICVDACGCGCLMDCGCAWLDSLGAVSKLSAYCTIQTHYGIWWLHLWLGSKWHFYCESILRLAVFQKQALNLKTQLQAKKHATAGSFYPASPSSHSTQMNFCRHLNLRHVMQSMWLCNFIFHSSL